MQILLFSSNANAFQKYLKIFSNANKCKYFSFEKFKCKHFLKVFKMHLNANAFTFDPISALIRCLTSQMGSCIRKYFHTAVICVVFCQNS